MSRTPEGNALVPFDMRSDIYSMLMPFFPEDKGLREYETEVGGYAIRISTDVPESEIATPSDRKILNILAGAIARDIRSGSIPTRHIEIDTRAIIEALDFGSAGGSQYARLLSRLDRLMATIIETEMPLGTGISRKRRFRWIDAYEHDASQTPVGRRLLKLKITISEDAYHWMTRTLGYDISRETFHSLTAPRSSYWRIYEICLARLIAAEGRTVHVGLEQLRRRVPISSSLKHFKSRTLRAAFEVIGAHPVMSTHLSLHLARRGATGYEPIDFSTRAKLDDLHVAVRKGPAPLPSLNRILAEDADISDAATADDSADRPRPTPQGDLFMRR